MFIRRVSKSQSQRGQSLLEVVMVAFILVMALVALISLTTVSIARNRLAKERTVATRLAQEGLEWFKYERDRLGFDAIVNMSNQPYCLSSFPAEADGGFEALPSDCVEGNVWVPGFGTIFKRTIQREVTSDDNEVKVSVIVEYRGETVALEGAVKKWER